MSSQPNTVNVTILDKDYLVACPPEARRELEKAASHLDRKMREIRQSGKVYGTERIAVMAALNLTHDFLEGHQQSSQYDRFLDDLEGKLNQALDDRN